MSFKDYYTILELAPSASPIEIKKAYRRLALVFHPDKNKDDPYALAQFEEIKEAYEVLSDPSKKHQYLEQRWYYQSIGKKSKFETLTPITLLKQSLEWEKFVSTLDIYRMNKEQLKEDLQNVLSPENIRKIQSFNEADINRAIIANFVKCLVPLSVEQSVQLEENLLKLAGDDATSISLIEKAMAEKKKSHRHRFVPLLIIILVTAFICLLMWMMG